MSDGTEASRTSELREGEGNVNQQSQVKGEFERRSEKLTKFVTPSYPRSLPSHILSCKESSPSPCLQFSEFVRSIAHPILLLDRLLESHVALFRGTLPLLRDQSYPVREDGARMSVKLV